MKLVVNDFFLADISFLGVISVWINIFSLGRHVLYEGCLKIRVLHSDKYSMVAQYYSPFVLSFVTIFHYL